MTGSTSLELAESPARALVKTEAGVASGLASKMNSDGAANSTLNKAEQRHALIAVAAYLIAEQRHFEPGHDAEDWLAAESALNLC